MNIRVCVFDKKNITIDENGKLSFKCSKEFARDMKNDFGIDVQSQSILRNAYFNTVDGKVSFTAPNRILQNR